MEPKDIKTLIGETILSEFTKPNMAPHAIAQKIMETLAKHKLVICDRAILQEYIDMEARHTASAAEALNDRLGGAGR